MDLNLLRNIKKYGGKYYGPACSGWYPTIILKISSKILISRAWEHQYWNLRKITAQDR